MNDAAGRILAACKKVRTTSPGSWVACCPAHEDRSPSMTVRETPDGMTLVHCFAGCSVEDICGATGVALEDLFPEKMPESRRMSAYRRRPFDAVTVLAAIASEAMVIGVTASDMHAKREISEEDYRRLWVAVQRINRAKAMALGED